MRKVNQMFDKCIYCGKDDVKLTDEHIVPYALNGTEILPKAACRKCQTIMSVFEGDVARKLAIALRVYFEYQTRKPEVRKQIKEDGFSLHLEDDGTSFDINIPIEDFGAVISFPLFAPPAYVTEDINRKGLVVTGIQAARTGGLHHLALRQKYGAKKTGYNMSFSGIAFAKLIAKVAYCYAIQLLGTNKFTEVYVLPSLLNQVNNIGKWVGQSPEDQVDNQDIEGIDIKGDLHVRIRLFEKLSPSYLVIVGKLLH